MTVSRLHDVLVELFRCRPALAGELLGQLLGRGLPAWHEARLESGELTALAPTQYRADAVVTLAARGSPTLSVVVEVQLRRDDDKRYSWPVYLATLRERLRYSAVLLVICVDDTTARWCAAPIELGPGSVVRPVVVGPGRVPMVTDIEQAVDSPELAVLSAMAHGTGPEQENVFRALLGGLAKTDQHHAKLYADVVLAALPAAARQCLEALMDLATYEYQSDYARRYFTEGKAEGTAEGEAKGEADALLTVLSARGIDVPDDARARITGCTDVEQLRTWIRRASTAASIHEVLA